jgi:hypothetical protein
VYLNNQKKQQKQKPKNKETRKPKWKPHLGGRLPGKNGQNTRKQLQQVTMNPDGA